MKNNNSKLNTGQYPTTPMMLSLLNPHNDTIVWKNLYVYANTFF